MMLVAALGELDESVAGTEAWTRVRDDVLVRVFGGRPGFGDGSEPDEHRFRIDDHWSPG